MPTPLEKFIRTLARLLSGDKPSDTSNEPDTSNESDTRQSPEQNSAKSSPPDADSDEPEPNTGDTTDESDTEQKPETEQPSEDEHSSEQSSPKSSSTEVDSDAPDKSDESDSSHDHDESHESDTSDESEVNHSSDESMDIDYNYPPVKRVEAVHEGVGDEEIDISLYHRSGDDYGLEACRMSAPYVNYAFEEAWGKKYTVDVTVVEEPVPRHVDSLESFDDWWWNDADPEKRSKDANCLIIDDDGVNGLGGTRTAVVNGPSYFTEWEYDPEQLPVLFGHGDNHWAVNGVIHEIGHGLGLTHDGDAMNVYGKRMVPPMETSYTDGDWFIHQLHEENRKVEPTINDPL